MIKNNKVKGKKSLGEFQNVHSVYILASCLPPRQPTREKHEGSLPLGSLISRPDQQSEALEGVFDVPPRVPGHSPVLATAGVSVLAGWEDVVAVVIPPAAASAEELGAVAVCGEGRMGVSCVQLLCAL